MHNYHGRLLHTSRERVTYQAPPASRGADEENRKKTDEQNWGKYFINFELQRPSRRKTEGFVYVCGNNLYFNC